ncbi:hypothetical protein ABFU82_14355 [Nocardioides sp. WV_118_6]
MKTPLLRAALAVLAIALLGLVTVPPASAKPSAPPPYDLYENPRGYPLTITPGYGCADPADEVPCTTQLTATLGVGFPSRPGAASARLVNLASGSRVALPTVYGTASNIEDVQIFTATALPSGRYELVATNERDGFWSCSIYNPDGCRWIEPAAATIRYRFVYTAGTTKTVLPYFAPETWLTRGQFWRKNKRTLVVTGRAVYAGVRSDYTPTPTKAAAHRKVTLQYKTPRGWRNLKRIRTRADGTFRLVARTPSAKRYRWQIVVAGGNGVPGGTFYNLGGPLRPLVR